MKKLRLQEEMSGLKHHFSIENAANVQATTSQQLDDEDIDPVDECKLVKRDICHMRMNQFIETKNVLEFFFCSFPVLHEIQERVDWLEEMEKLGEGHKYKQKIKSEIEERLRLIKRLQPDVNGENQ